MYSRKVEVDRQELTEAPYWPHGVQVVREMQKVEMPIARSLNALTPEYAVKARNERHSRKMLEALQGVGAEGIDWHGGRSIR